MYLFLLLVYSIKLKYKYYNIMEELPKVSICTPTYNRRLYFNAIIKCVEWQDYPKEKIEWIIVNDGNEEIEDILNIAKKTKNLPIIKYYKYNEKMNIGLKRNICNQYTTGDIIINMDDDDYYPPTRISHAVDVLTKNPNIYCAGISKIHIYFKINDILGILGPLSHNHACSGSLAFKRDLLKITSYNNESKDVEHFDFLLKYNLPIIHLDSLKTMIALSHRSNTSTNYNLVNHNKTVLLDKEKLEDYIQDEEILKLWKL